MEGAVGPVLTGNLPQATRLDLMGRQQVDAFSRRRSFLFGVFFVTCAILVFQIVQTRILSVIAWYYLAFFAISVAMLGMTIGSVWVYLRREQFLPVHLASDLSRYALATAVSIPASLMVQFSLVTTVALSVSTIVSWCL